MNDPLVSAVITTHNRSAELVLRAVRSALNQTYPNLEVIVVDDSSGDYAHRDEVERAIRSASEHIIYLRTEECKGACAARNAGLARAKGLYVAFLDDDDEWLPEKTEEQIKGFTDETAMVYSDYIRIDEVHHVTRVIRPREAKSGMIFDALLETCFIGSTSNLMLRRSCVEEAGGFDPQMPAAQDYELWLRIAEKYPVNYVNKVLMKYYVHEGARISAASERWIAGHERINEKYEPYLRSSARIWFMRHMVFIPVYLRNGWIGKAVSSYIRCLLRYPAGIWLLTETFVTGLLKEDSIVYSMVRRAKALFRKITKKPGQ